MLYPVIAFFALLALVNTFAPTALPVAWLNIQAAVINFQNGLMAVADISRRVIWWLMLYTVIISALLFGASITGIPMIQIGVTIFILVQLFGAMLALAFMANITAAIATGLSSRGAGILAVVPGPWAPTHWAARIAAVPVNILQAMTALPIQLIGGTLAATGFLLQTAAGVGQMVARIFGGTTLGLLWLTSWYTLDWKWGWGTTQDLFVMMIVYLIGMVWVVMYVAFDTYTHLITPYRVAVLTTAMFLLTLFAHVSPIMAQSINGIVTNLSLMVRKQVQLTNFRTYTGDVLYVQTTRTTHYLSRLTAGGKVWFEEKTEEVPATTNLFAGQSPATEKVNGREFIYVYPCGSQDDPKCLKATAPSARWEWVDSADIRWLSAHPMSTPPSEDDLAKKSSGGLLNGIFGESKPALSPGSGNSAWIKKTGDDTYDVYIPAGVFQFDTGLQIPAGGYAEVLQAVGESFGAISSKDDSYGPCSADGCPVPSYYTGRRGPLPEGSNLLALAARIGPAGSLPDADSGWTLLGSNGRITASSGGRLHVTLHDHLVDNTGVRHESWRIDNSQGITFTIRVSPGTRIALTRGISNQMLIPFFFLLYF